MQPEEKNLWVSLVEDRLQKEKIVSMVLSAPFLALCLQCVYWELGFPLLQQFWQQEGAANAKSL